MKNSAIAVPRWMRPAGWAISIAYVGYLVLGNLLLNLPVGRQLANLQPHKFVVGWSSAWTLYPGHAHVNDLRLAGHIRRTVWSVQADAASGRLALLPLLAKELRILNAKASGVTGGTSLIDVAAAAARAQAGRLDGEIRPRGRRRRPSRVLRGPRAGG